MSRKAPTTFQMYLPSEEKKAEIAREAEARGKSGSALLLEAYEEYLKNHPKPEAK